MFDNVRRRLPVVIAGLVAVTLTGQAALAQDGDQVSPSAIQSINVQKVDNLSAVKATSNLNKRSGKLMAVAGSGYLPNNIILKAMDSELLDGLDSTAFATLTALRSATGAVNEADNLVHWNQLFGVPATVLAGDTTRSFIAGISPVLAPGGTGVLAVAHPVGLEVDTILIPDTNGGFFTTFNVAPTIGGEWFVRSGTNLIQYIIFQNNGAVASAVKLRATVWNDTYLSPSAAKDKIKVTFHKKVPAKLREMLPGQ